jgi:glycosyltransferase involved in cell wall biosynthesis
MDISIIITAYNKGPYIRECLEGVLNQDFQGELEIILADDCSTDNTHGEVHALIEHPNFVKVKYIKHSRNKGLMGNFIWALSRAKGSYIALCDGDDKWIAMDKLSTQFSILEKFHEIIGVGTREEIIDTRNSRNKVKYSDLYIEYSGSQKIPKNDFFYPNVLPFHTSTLMFRNLDSIQRKLRDFRFVKMGNDIALYLILNNYGDLFFLDSSTVNRSHNELGITNDSQMRSAEIALNFYLIYSVSSRFYSLESKDKLLSIRNFYRDYSKKKYINANMFLLSGEFFYYLKFGILDIINFVFDVIRKKIRNKWTLWTNRF